MPIKTWKLLQQIQVRYILIKSPSWKNVHVFLPPLPWKLPKEPNRKKNVSPIPGHFTRVSVYFKEELDTYVAFKSMSSWLPRGDYLVLGHRTLKLNGRSWCCLSCRSCSWSLGSNFTRPCVCVFVYCMGDTMNMSPLFGPKSFQQPFKGGTSKKCYVILKKTFDSKETSFSKPPFLSVVCLFVAVFLCFFSSPPMAWSSPKSWRRSRVPPHHSSAKSTKPDGR